MAAVAPMAGVVVTVTVTVTFYVHPKYNDLKMQLSYVVLTLLQQHLCLKRFCYRGCYESQGESAQ